MRFISRTRAIFASAAVLAVLLTALLPASASPAVKPPVSTFSDATFGKVLSRRDKQVLYYWSVEKKAGGKVKCVGSCAVAWPPLIVKSRTAVPRGIAGISGKFGTIRRPDGRLQVTRNGLALYTYAHERPRQVLCNDVNGWFVVRVR
jgi:predicted lipoprotein with Yx(FWY)xxD motif